MVNGVFFFLKGLIAWREGGTCTNFGGQYSILRLCHYLILLYCILRGSNIIGNFEPYNVRVVCWHER